MTWLIKILRKKRIKASLCARQFIYNNSHNSYIYERLYFCVEKEESQRSWLFLMMWNLETRKAV